MARADAGSGGARVNPRETSEPRAWLSEIPAAAERLRRKHRGRKWPLVHLHGVGLNAHVVASEETLLDLLRLPGCLDRLRRQGYALKEILRLRLHAAQLCKRLDITPPRFQQVIRVALRENLARFAPDFLPPGDQVDARRAYLVQRHKEAVYRGASLAQALARGFLTRKLPRMLPWKRRIARCQRLIEWEVLGEVCVRAKVDHKEAAWSRMRRMQVVISQGEILLCSPEAENRHEALASPFLTIYTDSDVRVWIISSRTAVLRNKTKTQFPGCCLEPCVVDEGGLEAWVSQVERERLRAEMLAKPSRGAVWWYACSDKPVHVAVIDNLNRFLRGIVGEARARAACNERYQRWTVEASTKRPARAQRGLDARLGPHQIRGVRDRIGALKTRLAACRKERAWAREELAALAACRGEGDRNELPPLPKALKSFWMVSMSRRRAFGAGHAFDVSWQGNFFTRHRAGYVASLHGNLRWRALEFLSLRRDIASEQGIVVSAMAHQYRRWRARRALQARHRRAVATKVRFRESMEDFDKRLESMAHVRDSLAALNRQCAARAMQRAYRSRRAWDAQRACAALVICRFGRFCVARLEVWRLLRLKADQDAKVRFCLQRMRDRTRIKAFARWQEFFENHVIWRQRLETLQRRCANRTLCRTAHALFDMRRGLAEGLLDSGALHPRLGQLLGEFMQRRHLDLLLCRLANDFASRSAYGVPARTMESDARLSCHRKRYADSPRRWRLPISNPSQALDDILLPYYRFPLVDVSSRGQFLLCNFWRVMMALNAAYWAFSQTLRKACTWDLRAQSEAVLGELRRKSRTSASQRMVVDPPKDPLIRIHAPSELCVECAALLVKLQHRCPRCGELRVRREPRRRDLRVNCGSTSMEPAICEEDPFDRYDDQAMPCIGITWPSKQSRYLESLHAAFFRRLEGSQDRLLKRWLEVCPERFMTATPDTVRAHLDHEAEWWSATQMVSGEAST